MNKVIIIGRIGKIDAKENYTRLSIATNTKYKGEDITQWHDCVAFGKTAELVNKYLEKGSQVGIEGSLSYNIKEKIKYTSIIIERLDILEWKKAETPQEEENNFNFDDEIPF